MGNMKYNLVLLLFLVLFGIINSFENCKLQYADQDFCYTCEEGYGLNLEGGCKKCTNDEPISFLGICFKEISNCSFYYKYIDKDTCSKCEEGFELNQDHTKCIKCGEGKITIEGESICVDEKCIDIYNGFCDECQVNYALSQNKIDCIKCDENKIAPFGKCVDKIENCKVYKDDKNCEKCEDNYYVDGGICKSCPNNQISKGKVCFEKVINCYIYDEYGVCLKCEYYYQNNGYKLNSQENKCYECEEGTISNGNICLKRIDNCYSYSYVNDEIKCSSCNKNYGLTLDNLECKYCETGKFFGGLSCIDDSKTISHCRFYSEDGRCIKCSNAYKLVDGQCSVCMRTFDSRGYNCFQLHSFCSEHNDVGECIKCNSGFKLNTEGNCVIEDLGNTEETGNNAGDQNNDNNEKLDDTTLITQKSDNLGLEKETKNTNLNKSMYINITFRFNFLLIFSLFIIL